MEKGRALGLVSSTPRLSSLRRLETVMGVARAGSRLMALPNPPTSDLEAEFGLSNKPGVGDWAILPQLGGSEGRGTAGLATPPVPRRAAVGGYGGRG